MSSLASFPLLLCKDPCSNGEASTVLQGDILRVRLVSTIEDFMIIDACCLTLAVQVSLPPAIAAWILNADFKSSHLDEGSAPLWDTPGTPAPCVICQQATSVDVRHACLHGVLVIRKKRGRQVEGFWRPSTSCDQCTDLQNAGPAQHALHHELLPGAAPAFHKTVPMPDSDSPWNLARVSLLVLPWHAHTLQML